MSNQASDRLQAELEKALREYGRYHHEVMMADPILHGKTVKEAQTAINQAIKAYVVAVTAEAKETILQEAEHTTECNCCGNGGGEHDLTPHLEQVARSFDAQVTALLSGLEQ